MNLHELTTLFTRDLEKLRSEIEQYPTDQSLWMVEEGISNSGGNLCTHLCGNLRHFIGANLGQDGYIRNREQEFSISDLSKTELMSEIDETISAVKSALSNMSESDMEHQYPEERPIPNSSNGLILMHLYAHLSYHLGQINYHRRLLA